MGDQIRVERDDTTLETTYGLREGQTSQLEVSDLAAIQANGDAFIRKYGSPVMKVSMDIVRSTTPTIVDFALGDLIRVIVQKGIYDIDETFRVFEWNVMYGTDNTETLTLTLGNFNLGDE